jgi:hypothetical protein
MVTLSVKEKKDLQEKLKSLFKKQIKYGNFVKAEDTMKSIEDVPAITDITEFVKDFKENLIKEKPEGWISGALECTKLIQKISEFHNH